MNNECPLGCKRYLLTNLHVISLIPKCFKAFFITFGYRYISEIIYNCYCCHYFFIVDIFIESRDRCDKDPLFPSFELTLKNGYLWPVVVLERKSVLYCALPFEKLETYKSKSFFNM